MKTFNSVDDIQYKDWRYFMIMTTIEDTRASRLKLAPLSLLYKGLFGASLAFAILSGGATAIGLGILAGLLFCADAVTNLMMFSFPSTDENPTKEEIKQAKKDYKQLKASKQWEHLCTLMRAYQSSERFNKERSAYYSNQTIVPAALLPVLQQTEQAIESKSTKAADLVIRCKNKNPEPINPQQKSGLLAREVAKDINTNLDM